MKIMVIADDLLLPVNSGGRAELFNSCNSLVAWGHEVRVVSLAREAAVLEQPFLGTIVPRKSFIRATMRHPLLPYQVSSRMLGSLGVENLGFKPDVVIAQHEWTVPAAIYVARKLDSRLLVRSHNDEVAFLKSLHRHARGLRRWYYLLELSRLKMFMRSNVMREVGAIAAISDSDAQAYQKLGFRAMVVPPSLFDSVPGRGAREAPPRPTILFVGALDLAHTSKAVLSFVEEVLPQILEGQPNAELVVAGRRAPRDFVKRLSRFQAVRYLGEVDDLSELYTTSRVFVNPVSSGSGVNMKVGPPLWHGLPVVTTEFGARGLGALKSGVFATKNSSDFASTVLKLLSDDDLWVQQSQSARDGCESYVTDVVRPAYRIFLEEV